MSFFNKNVKDSIEELKSNDLTGISSEDAKKRLEEYGHNALAEAKQKSKIVMFFEQFKDFLVIILIIAAGVSMFVGLSTDEGILDSLVIIAIVIINSIIGVTQEAKASNALKALKEMSSPQAKVIRDNHIQKVAASDLVPGDIVVLDAGDYIPADLRLVESINLKVDESALTGESVPVEKDANSILGDEASLGDRINSAYMGTVITYGRGRGLVSGTGMNTEMGHIAAMLSHTDEEETPLQRKLDRLGKSLGIVCLAVCAAIFALGLWQGKELMEIFMVSVSLAVAAIPEGLTVVVTVVLALGMQKMVKSNAIVKRLSAVETLGSTTVICSDKTGTLTQNKMTVVKLFDYDTVYSVTGTGYQSEGEIYNEITKSGERTSNIDKLIEGATLCNDSIYEKSENRIIGDPTEGAMIVLAEKAKVSKESLNVKYPRIKEIPFDSERKLMSTFHSINNKNTVYTKGAPDELLKKCVNIYKDGNVEKLSDEDRAKILAQNSSFAENALRVLGVAYKEIDNFDNYMQEEKELTYLGLMCMIDPPREEVKPAVSECKRAGINVKMITGDHKITASAIARDLGIMGEGEEAIEGAEIQKMTDDELQEKVKTVNVFARVSPEHKVRLVSAVKANGHIAAMTGDGVNDAPSLKRADIGVAMGITGTDVSKEAADMILTDDNFVSIVKAVEEGRTIYNNIRKVVGYLLSCNIGEILLIFLSMLAGLPMPLAPIHLLSINLITDAFPAFALGMEAKEDDVMDAKPRDPNESIINGSMKIAVTLQSIFLGVGSLAAYIVTRNIYGDDEVATTVCFVALVLGELFRAYSAKSEKTSIFKMKLFNNSALNKCVLFSLIFVMAAVYVPFLENIFLVTPLLPEQIGIALAFSIIPTIGGELAKVITNRK